MALTRGRSGFWRVYRHHAHPPPTSTAAIVTDAPMVWTSTPKGYGAGSTGGDTDRRTRAWPIRTMESKAVLD